MYRMMPLVKRLLCAAALLFTVLAMLPVGSVSADEGSGFTPKQQAQADRLKAQYQKLRSDMSGLNDLYDKAASYRQSYVTFMNGEAVNKHDTSMLQQALALSDGFITQGRAAQKKGFEDLAYPNGFDASGQNVKDINAVSRQIQAALPDYLLSRGLATRAIYYLHSALNLYHQRTSLGVPNVPKYHPPLYCLACDIAN